MRGALFIGGQIIIAAGAGLPLILPELPSSIQNRDTPWYPVGPFIIQYQNWIVLFGLLLVILSVFL